jgi:hypothetical protein
MTTFASLSPARKSLLLSLGVLFILSIVRIVTNADDLTSSGTISSTMRVATPILLAGLAGLAFVHVLSQRVGALDQGHAFGIQIAGNGLEKSRFIDGGLARHEVL